MTPDEFSEGLSKGVGAIVRSGIKWAIGLFLIWCVAIVVMATAVISIGFYVGIQNEKTSDAKYEQKRDEWRRKGYILPPGVDPFSFVPPTKGTW
jgi:hypothetical protein